MNRNGPVIIIEDDLDDQEFFSHAFNNLSYSNQLIFFTDGEKALEYLNKTRIVPFIILCDINMPKLDGFALREILRTQAILQNKSIPFLFLSTALNHKTVVEAYNLSAQGFFVKQTSMQEMEKTIIVMMEYWKRCAAPNNFA